MSNHPDLIERITGYLATGGLFNPELANHDAVRDLLIESRDALSSQSLSLSEAREEIERLRTKEGAARAFCLASGGDPDFHWDGAKDWQLVYVGRPTDREEIDSLKEDVEIAERQRDEALEALRNVKGLIDTPLARRRHKADPFYEDVVASVRSVLENSKARLADAHTNPPLSDLSSLRKGAEVVVTDAMVNAAWNEAKTRRMTGLPNDFRAVLEAALVSGSREDGASLLRTIETLPDDFTDDGNCCAGKLKEPRP